MVASQQRKWWALALLSAVQFMVVLDIAIVNVALPSIQVDLGFSQQNLQWVISAYALVFGGFLLLGGRAADLLGRRRIFLVGLVVFTLASLFAGLAWSETSLIAARAVHGLGAAVITRSEEHTSELQSPCNLVCRLLLEKKKNNIALLPLSDPFAGGIRKLHFMLLKGVHSSCADSLSYLPRVYRAPYCSDTLPCYHSHHS